MLLMYSSMMLMTIHNYQQLKALMVVVDNLYLFLYVSLNDIEVLVLSYIVLDKIHKHMVIQLMYTVDDDYQ